MVWGTNRVVATFNIPREDIWLLERVEELSQLEKVSKSKILREALKEYIDRHYEKGNPQSRLVPKSTEYMNPVLEKRRSLIDDLETTVQRNPGLPRRAIESAFSAATGLRQETVKGYIDTLIGAGRVTRRWDRLYPKE